MIFNGVMSNQSQNDSFYLTCDNSKTKKIVETFLKNDFVGKASSFHSR